MALRRAGLMLVLVATACAAAATPAPTSRPAVPTATPSPAEPTPTPTATATALAKVPIRIMPLGDSLTWGLPDPNYGGYRHLLGKLLTADGYLFDFVGSQQSGEAVFPDSNNEGHPGWTIWQIKRGIDANGWLETYQPDLILLHIGTSDIYTGSAVAATKNLADLLNDILARLPETHIIVAQIINAATGPDAVHRAYNAAIPGLVEAEGPRVTRVDMQNILTASDYAGPIHPNDGGYDKMARAWEAAIRAVESK